MKKVFTVVVYKRFFLKFVIFVSKKNKKKKIIFFQTPRSTDKPLKASTNAKVQIYLWLGVEEHERHIFKQLPPGFDMPSLPLSPDQKNIRYHG
jgi:hypothetical protein